MTKFFMVPLMAAAVMATISAAVAQSVTCMDLGDGFRTCSNGWNSMDLGDGFTTYSGPDGQSGTSIDLGDGFRSYNFTAPPQPIQPAPVQTYRSQPGTYDNNGRQILR